MGRRTISAVMVAGRRREETESTGYFVCHNFDSFNYRC